MRLKINKEFPFPVYLQIKNSIKEQILTGILPPGFVLPPERKLADSNGVSRTTVIRAYDELKALGLVESYIGKGTVVTERREPDTSNKQSYVFPLSWYPLFDKKLGYVSDTITDIMNVGHQKDMISFAAGVGDPDLYPIKQLKAIQAERAYNSEALNLCAVEGYYPLRESLSKLMQFRSLSVSPKEVMILSGSMQGIDFTARTFLSPGDAVIVEEPTFLQAIQCFRAAGAKIIGIPLDDEGIRTDVLEAQLSRYKPKFIYTIPTFHNPTGIVMSMKRKMELLHLAYKYQVPVLEDDPYGEISFDQQERPPLKALDSYDYVIYLGTFSKVLFSGTRVGWVIGPEPVMKRFALLKQITDLHVNTPGQFMLDRYLREGFYEAHLKNELAVYKKKRDFMAAALRQNHGLIAFNVPDGGYYHWCRIPEQVSQKDLLSLCASKGMLFTPGTVFYPQESDGAHFLRLNYTYESFERITKGVAILIEALEKLNGQKTEDRVHRENRPIV
ncbi:PLP-dependent aminotransferase family protein [Sporolactobacillus shoreae]|uniref:PLP-dependent aminotransferase family protein n=1 Tax=Sporolactobacillus shoreae TaxID=1465501 RepID=A0A4Z0GKX7_9BACL|nr:PLP-dependent aminotransferase family protein [Sporolactobacillus shoreae]TGA96284.1 PLP-dependent aminotransferase family protein [Sporolactobacillus shoreae]